MDKNITKKIKDIMVNASDEAKYYNDSKIRPMHIMLGLIKDSDNKALDYMFGLKVDVDELHDKILEYLANSAINVRILNSELHLSQDSKMILKHLEPISLEMGSVDINELHLLLALTKYDSPVKLILNNVNVKYNNLKNMIKENENFKNGYIDGSDENADPNFKQSFKREKGNGTPFLDQFCRNISTDAENDKIDPVVGREVEIKRLSQILGRRKKNNPVIIGEAGVGKTAIVEGLAKMILENKAPRLLLDKKIYSLDMSSMVAGTKYRGEFEQRMKMLLEELKANSDIILFIDELHTIVGAGNAGGSLDAGNIFKPALARGEIQVIGATTLDEYREHIEKDTALVRRFQEVKVNEPTLEETVIILQNLKEKYENHHKVTYTDEAIRECVKLSDRYIADRSLPDKAIDIMDEAGSATQVNVDFPESIKELEKKLIKIREEKTAVIKAQEYEKAANIRDKEKALETEMKDAKIKWEETISKNRVKIDIDLISEVVSIMTGIPVNKISTQENKKLLELHNTIKNKVIGQDAAVEEVCTAIKRNRLGINDKNRPIGSFIFIGQTGVGKTYLAKELAKSVFGDSDAMIRVDMSEYSESYTTSKLVGSAPGYVGYNEGGTLAEKIRQKPYCVLLLDEIEKAHQNVFNLLLQVLDDGHLQDSTGRRINFKNVLIIMTSNVGVKKANELGKTLGFNASEEMDVTKKKSIINKAMEAKFAPEFLNRLDNIIFFNPLSKEDINKIVNLELDVVRKSVVEKGFDVKLTKKAISFIGDTGYNVNFGARPIKRSIQNLVSDTIVDKILSGDVKEGQTFKFDLDTKENKLVMKVQ